MDTKVKLVLAIMAAMLLVGCNQFPFLNQQNNTNTTTATTQTSTLPNATNATANNTLPPPPPSLIIPPFYSGNLTAYVINVGQGDSIFVIGPNNKTMLIDCGPTEAGTKVVQFVRNLGFATIDYLVVSHPHEDHIGGCPLAILKLKPTNIFDNGHSYTTEAYKNYAAVWTNHTAIDTDKPFDFDMVYAQFIVPYDDGQGFSSNENDNSVLVKLTYNNVAYLFEGDCESDCEARVINSNLAANILKVGHHGSRTSSSLLFLNAVHPSIAAISAGLNNQYGHPHAETLEKLKQKAVTVYRTDQDGSIVITTDGKTIGVEKVK